MPTIALEGDGDNGPPIPPQRRLALNTMYLNWPDTYRALGQEFNINDDPPQDSDGPDLQTVNDARDDYATYIKARYTKAKAPPPDPSELPGKLPQGLLPTTTDTGKTVEVLDAVFTDDPPDSGGDPTVVPDDEEEADDKQNYFLDRYNALTTGYIQWQMWGTQVALMLARIKSFHQHGGRPTKGT